MKSSKQIGIGNHPRSADHGVGPQSHVDANNAKTREIRTAGTVLNVTVLKLTNQETRTSYLSRTRGNRR